MLGEAPPYLNRGREAATIFIDSDIDVSVEKMKVKVTLPELYEVATDRAPTRDEVKRILLHCHLEAKTEITMLASSGMRIGELPKLKVNNVEFGEKGEPSRIRIKAGTTKTRKARMTFISPEATELLKEHLGERIGNPNARLFEEESDAIYSKIMRALIKADLRKKLEDSVHYDLHPHCFRKYFHTNMLAKGVDRGIVEGSEGHKFGLDSNYLRMNEDQLKDEYGKGLETLTFLSNSNGIKAKVEQIDAKLAKIEETARGGGKGSRIAVIEAAKELRKEIAENWLSKRGSDATIGFVTVPAELTELDKVIEVLENPESGALEVYKAQRKFDKMIGVSG